MSERINTAIILAGGFGTRLQSVVDDVPKPMAPVAERPFLEYVLDYLSHFGIETVVLSTGHLAHVVSDYFGDRYKAMKLVYAVEKDPLGTGGAILNSFNVSKSSEALVLNGDSFLDADLSSVLKPMDSGSDGRMVLRMMPKPDRFGTVTLNDQSKVVRFEEKQIGLPSGLINAGIYVLQRRLFERFGLEGTFSIEEDFFKPFISKMKIEGIISDGYFIDIGLPDEFAKAQLDFQSFKYSV